jgi:RNA 3'-terminal phosphate cyclase (ATP)
VSSWVDIDGSEGEGGGQILRTALSLSACTGVPVRMHHIRAKRAKPGLMRQHLTALQAIAELCTAKVVGDRVGSAYVSFEPGHCRGGTRRFAIGTAGSTTLVAQTVMWPLLQCGDAAEITIEGGTYNPLAPPVDFLARALAPRLLEMGAQVHVELVRAGFYPAGGGEMVLRVVGKPAWRPREFLERGVVRRKRARALVANLPKSIGDRELRVVGDELGWSRAELHCDMVLAHGPGNALLLEVESEHATTIVSSIGERGRRAEVVAGAAIRELQTVLAAEVPVDAHLADQLVVPMALAGGGAFRTLEPTGHLRSQLDLVPRFLDVRATASPEGGAVWRVEISA